jgi:hypothetical protein
MLFLVQHYWYVALCGETYVGCSKSTETSTCGSRCTEISTCGSRRTEIYVLIPEVLNHPLADL